MGPAYRERSPRLRGGRGKAFKPREAAAVRRTAIQPHAAAAGVMAARPVTKPLPHPPVQDDPAHLHLR